MLGGTSGWSVLMSLNLGLRRHTVRLVDHDPDWFVVFDELRARLSDLTGLTQDRIAHVGSTAVPRIPAKPILDVAVLAESRSEVLRVAAALAEGGFIDRGDGEGSIGRLLVLEPEPDVRSAHVHILEEAASHWDDYHLFLSLLRTDAEARQAYSDAKLEIARIHADDRRGYTAAKAEYVSALLATVRDTRRGAP